MKYVIGLFALVVFLAAVYFLGTEKFGKINSVNDRFIAACVQNGDTRNLCNCTVTAMSKNMSEENFLAAVTIMETQDSVAGERLMEKMLSENPEMIASFAADMSRCVEG